MKVTVKEGMVILDACQLFENMELEEKNKLIQSLACGDDIIRHVMDQVLDGCTEAGYFGGTSGDASTHGTPIDQARRRIAAGAGEVATETIASLRRALEHEKKSCSEWVGKYHEIADRRHVC